MKVTLVGMGSGAPGSLTAQGLNALREARAYDRCTAPAGGPARWLHGTVQPRYKPEEICALLRTTEAAHVRRGL